jgi:transcriptional regulator with XRE-family HTH domain
MASEPNPLGAFLRERRARLDPAALGFPVARRRTPGLRREEVASRAAVSATWYTWLEQGRGGAPSADTLDRLARALALSDAEREHLFLLAQARPPAVRYQGPPAVSAQLRGVLDTLASPALIKDAAWNILAWNRAAAAVLGDYAQLAAADRNLLRLIFLRRPDRGDHWERDARYIVSTFRLAVARAGAGAEAAALVAELSAASADFRRLWAEGEVRALGESVKVIEHAQAGPLELCFNSFAVEGQPELGLIVYTPATPASAAALAALMGVAALPV